MFEIVERYFDLGGMGGKGMVGKNVSTVWKVSIPNNWITRPTKVGIIKLSHQK